MEDVQIVTSIVLPVALAICVWFARGVIMSSLRFARDWFVGVIQEAVDPRFAGTHEKMDEQQEANEKAHREIKEDVAEVRGELHGHITTAARRNGDTPDADSGKN